MIAVALFFAAAAQASSGLSPCVRKNKGALVEPPTLDALVDCQSKALAAASAAFGDKHEGLPPDEKLTDRWEDAQRAETQNYIKRHPARAGLTAKSAGTAGAAASAADAKPETSGSDEDKLKADLESMSDGGKKGVTPAMAQEITDYLNKKQGGVSPEMKDLLDSLQKDGVNLTDDSMLKLKKAARAADGAGLDLGVDPKMKQELLDPATDPKPGARAPGAPTN